MIISASRRTDIPAFYSDWFFNRIKEGYVLVRNPMNIHQVSKIKLSPDVVDCIVFWTKNPKPMLDKLDELKDYRYYFQFTLNSYSNDIEPNVPSKSEEIINTFKQLSDLIGRDRVIWRYDPIILSEKYTVQYHIKYFEKLSQILNGSFNKCVISFVDFYKKNARTLNESKINEPVKEEINLIAKAFSEISKKYDFEINTCTESIDLSSYGINHGKCIDDKLIEQLCGCRISANKDKNQRDICGCIESIDIGLYNTCMHKCKYCYANYSLKTVDDNYAKYNPNSPLLCSELLIEDKIIERNVKSLIDDQLTMW